MNKRILSFIFTILLGSACFSVEMDNEILIVGFDESLSCVAFYKTEINSGKGDKKNSFLVYDLKNDKYIESTKAKYMADYYQGPGGTIDNWSDEKYTVSAYYSFNKSAIDEICRKYNFQNIEVLNQKLITEIIIRKRTDIDGLRENIDYSVVINLEDKKIELNKNETSVCFIKDITVKSVWFINNSYVLLLKKSHKGFEGDDFIDYEFVMDEMKSINK